MKKNDLINIDIINQMFGHLIKEAYQKDDIKEYIKGVKITDKDDKVLSDFEYLAKKLINLKNRSAYSKHERSDVLPDDFGTTNLNLKLALPCY